MSDKIVGRNPVLEAIKAGRGINKIMLLKGGTGRAFKDLIAAAREKGIPLQEVDRSFLNNLADGENHQGVVALAASKEYVDVDDILALAQSKGEAPFIVLLDEIEDPHNLGSILRTADAAGVHGVIIPKRRAVGLTPAVSKASAGAVEYIPVARVTNLAQTIDYLKEKGCWVAGTDAGAQDLLWEKDLNGPMALVLGSEGKGVGRLIKEKCDFLVKLPMGGQISSLNVAVAAGLMMYEIVRQRGAGK
ncbi:MAG: 23S rRNA (guanosine(2251)-2'-O)-methyltransferase RlmB [Clostridia bacterium]|nr:23S rRNA (guanosine(2251)-2'-O)-methyltransferase RlmB [Clostridia bacterium]